MSYANNCPECNENMEDCFCEEVRMMQQPPSQFSFTVTCSECGYGGSIELVKLHSCDIALNGGRCEDYPCCGHTDGDGCQTLREHTSEYWTEMFSRYPDIMDD